MLKTWITGTKDFTDQGLAPSEWVNDNVTIVDGGKLGKCMYFNGTSSRLSTTGYTLGNKWSWACWVKEDPSVTAWQGVIALNNNGSDNDMQTALWLRANEHRFEVCNNTKYNSTIQYTQGQWNHYAMSFDGTTTIAYLNGIQVATFTSSSILSRTNLTIGARSSNANGGHTSATNFLKGYINDLRIWDDEAISPLQVKQLSQGLVLHYPLDNNGFGNENLLSRYVVPGQAGPTSTAAGGRTTWLGDYKITIPATENADTYFRLFTTKQLTTNATYTISCNVDGLLSGSFYRFPLYAQNNTAMGVLNLDHNGLCSLTFTMTYGTQTAATGANGETVYICFMDDAVRTIASGQGAITISNFKLEEGSIATPWCPNKNDELAIKMGMNDGIEYDCSGFGNNGTRTGIFTWTSNTLKYTVSQVFNGVDNAIQTPNLTTMVTDKNYTITCWTYKTVIGTKNYQTIYGGPSGFELEARSSSSTSPLYRIHNWGGGTTAYNFGEWTHFCFVHTDSDSKLYVNGELKITGTSVNIPSGNYFVGAWNTATQQNFEGLMSDFRVYATALSASDVLSLYQNSAYIDSSGNVYGAVHTEV